MKLNKKVFESMTVATALAVMSTFTAFAGSTEDITGDAAVIAAVLDKNGTAGVISDLQKIGSHAMNEEELVVASIQKNQNETVLASGEESETVLAGVTAQLGESAELAKVGELSPEIAVTEEITTDMPEATEIPVEVMESTEVPEEITEGTEATVELAEAEVTTEDVLPEQEVSQDMVEAPVATNSEWANRLMANVEEDMNVRTQPGEDAELAGKLFRGDIAEVVSVGDGWTQITSGNVTGYVKNEFCVYGTEAEQLANEVCTTFATVNTGGLRLRNEPSEEASIVTTAAEGDKLNVDKDAAPAEGWVAVKTSDSTAYVSAEYVSLELNLGSALTSEEIAAKEAEEEKSKKKPAVSAGGDEVRLLAALIQCEAGNSSYEGMLAVGSVVMNRVRSGAYPGSISGVVYQPGQFPPALNGSVANVAAGGVKSSCLQAAQEAINGTDITNGALSFRSGGSGAAGTVIGGNVFF